MARVNCVVQIDAGENGEDIGLQERDQQFEAVSRTMAIERQRRRQAR